MSSPFGAASNQKADAIANGSNKTWNSKNFFTLPRILSHHKKKKRGIVLDTGAIKTIRWSFPYFPRICMSSSYIITQLCNALGDKNND